MTIKDINKIKPLWNKLNDLHKKKSTYFKDYFDKNSFEKRITKFNNIDENNMLIEVVKDKEIITAYCISSIDNSVGELDSLFVSKNYRSFGFGKRLFNSSLKWMKEKKCKKIQISVAEGNEEVFSFYQKNNFYPKMTYFELID